MSSDLRVAIVGGGIAGLCLAATLIQHNPAFPVAVYEASPALSEIGAGLTLWGRVCEALELMELADPCIRASVVVASTSGLQSSQGFMMRSHRDPATSVGRLPFKDAWSLARWDLIRIVADRVPAHHTHYSKKLVAYHDPPAGNGPVTLFFADGTTTTCDVLVGADGLRSVVRAQMMREAGGAPPPSPSGPSSPSSARRASGRYAGEYEKYVEPRWCGTIAYRALIKSEDLRARSPRHPMLDGGQIYFGKSKHVVGYPISGNIINLAVNTTTLALENTPWPAAPPRTLDRAAFRAEIAPLFSGEGWDEGVGDIIECIDSVIEWPVMDLEPLPFYTRGHVVLIGDSAHAAVPYVGAGAAFAIEDAYILARLLLTPRSRTAPLRPLRAYDAVRRPYGNRLVRSARRALREFQGDGPSGEDVRGAARAVGEVFDEAARVGGAGPEGDALRGVGMVEGV